MNFNTSPFKLEIGKHKETDVIWLYFSYNRSLIDEVKKIKARYSSSHKAWYVPDTRYYRELFHLQSAGIGKQALSQIHPINRSAAQKLEDELRLKAYSPSTIRTYCLEFAQLLYILKDHPVDTLTPDRLRSYLLYCIKELKISENQLHSRLNAIKFYFEQVLKQPQFFAEIPRPKKPSSLPRVLSTTDVLKILDVVENPKHKLMLQLCYGMGLRVSELANLKIGHVDSRRMQVLIAGAKGKKDRYVNLPQSVLDDLRGYFKVYRPKDFLFEGQYGGAICVRTVQAVFKQAMKKARVNKKIGIHCLRHSYATHLHEYGTDISLIQKLLGHNQIKTTIVYTHVSNKSIAAVQSPLDRIS